MILKKTSSPNYSHKQEVCNSLLHFFGVLFAIAVTITFAVITTQKGLAFSTTYPFYIYSITMFITFSVSTFYHSAPLNSRLRQVSRVVDHSDIYAFVAGTYTPITLLAITNSDISIGLLITEWSLAFIGILITALWFKHRIVSLIGYIIYIIAGWALMFVYPFNQCLPFDVFIYILLGGVAYTIGAITYGIGKKNPWFHTIFHVFILLGAVIQFVGVFNILSHLH